MLLCVLQHGAEFLNGPNKSETKFQDIKIQLLLRAQANAKGLGS